MQSKFKFSIIVASVGVAGGLALFLLNQASRPTPDQQLKALGQKQHVDPRGYAKELGSLIDKYDSSPNKVDQDVAVSAKLRLAYSLSKKKDYGKAREVLLSAAKNRGTDRHNPDYGTLSDQARYQAIVCLVAENKSEQARQEFIQFIKDRPRSEMTIQCYRRLVRMNGGVPRPEDQKLIEHATAIAQASIQRDLASCGPIALSRLLDKLGKPNPGVEQLQQECKTGSSGTTLDAMQNVLASRNVNMRGYKLNRLDFARMTLPAIWLKLDHFVLVESVEPDFAIVFDPLDNHIKRENLPTIDDKDFTAVVLAPAFEIVKRG